MIFLHLVLVLRLQLHGNTGDTSRSRA